MQIKTQSQPGRRETTANFVPPPYYAVTGAIPRRIEFSCSNDRVEITGTCESKQDLRDTLRELLAALEVE